MTKKILSIFIALLLCIATFTVIAEDVSENLLQNGDFEKLGAKAGYPDKWTLSTSRLESADYSNISDEDARSGKYSIKVSASGPADNNPRVVWLQKIAVTPGAEYTFSVYIKAESLSKYGARLRVLDEKYNEVAVSSHITNTKGKWEKIELSFKCPEDLTNLSFKLRWDGKGTAFFDDAVLTGKGHKVQSVESTTSSGSKSAVVLSSVSQSEAGNVEGNLIKNYGLEDVVDGVPTGWRCYGNNWTNEGLANVVSDVKRSGNNSLKLEAYSIPSWATSSAIQSYASNDVTGIQAGCDYEVSAWMKVDTIIKSGKSGAYISWEFYNAETATKETYMASGTSGEFLEGAVGAWMEMKYTISIPKETKTLRILFRLLGSGTIYYDDVALVPKGAGARIELDTNNYINYSDTKTNIAEVTLNTSSYKYATDPVIDFYLKDGETILAQQLGTPIKSKALFRHDVALLKEKGKDYTVEASIRETPGGEILETQTIPVCRYDRPTGMTKEGLFKKDDNTLMEPVMAWHVHAEQYEAAAQAGITVVQSDTINNILGQLDAAKAAGIYVMVQMYANGYRDLTPEAAELNKNLVLKVKDHPALWGYLLDDEPAMRTNMNISESLRYRYKIIRDLDPVHPIAVVEQKKSEYDWAAKYCDVFVYDDYVLGVRPLISFKDSMRSGVRSVNYDKPVIGLMQCIVISANYEPSIHEIRHMAYQSLWAEGAAFAYFGMYGSGFDTRTTAVWSGMVEFKQSGEYDMIFDVLALQKYPTLTECVNGNVWYKVWINGANAYVIAMNMTTEKQTVTIPLSGAGGAVKIGDFSGELLYGDSTIKTISGNGAAEITLEKDRTSVYKITPSEMPDITALSSQNFADTDNYSWAKNEIESLNISGIINKTGKKTYSPSENITRGDFAMYLMRTLGLTADTVEQFFDVKSNLYYSDEIAMGKSLGILKGVGDEKFNPEAEISRQDLMVICARGMRLLKEMNNDGTDLLGGFSDKSAIADYALTDIAAMVRANIVKGNADGTINPLGNATRAEAAAIMSRILDWKQDL